MYRSIVELACEVEASGLCTPDYVLAHDHDPEIYARLHEYGYDRTVKNLEHYRHFLFDELPEARTISRGLWTDPKAALRDYLDRIGESDKEGQVTALWN